MVTCARMSAFRPSSSLHASRQHPVIPWLFLFIWSIFASIVTASVLPADVRSELTSLRSLSAVSSPHGEIAHDDPEDVSHSPQERAEGDHRVIRRDVTIELDGSLIERATSLPILVASDEHDHAENDDEPSSLVGRSVSKDMPKPFDTAIKTNFTSSSCETFVNDFLSNSTFTDCHAVSMLLRNSLSFFRTVRSATATSHLLDISCNVDVDKCSAYMTELAGRLLKKDACSQDYKEGNSIVTDAYRNMVAYEPIYKTTCLKNPSTSDYCFVDASTNTNNSADYNVYFIPYGSAITNAPFPTCNKCVQASMDIFAKYAQKTGQFLVRSYLSSAEGMNSKCGSDFANVNITVGEDKLLSSAASWSAGRPSIPLQYLAALGTAVLYLGLL